ncbi:hypothetical protein AMTR_s00151p00090450 [Amborella trichopoda]|uniref:Uncharacterized protein n=1 Tax=Amborella trichopoda TaxID=13333 RepID=W1NJ74_AMBTC|nr:hypothetical protein AMTR_s00151p00090450 [Amborella trichopoda]
MTPRTQPPALPSYIYLLDVTPSTCSPAYTLSHRRASHLPPNITSRDHPSSLCTSTLDTNGRNPVNRLPPSFLHLPSADSTSSLSLAAPPVCYDEGTPVTL